MIENSMNSYCVLLNMFEILCLRYHEVYSYGH
jgi:hypothetical protein